MLDGTDLDKTSGALCFLVTQVFFLWSWEMLTHLRLHRLDQPESQVRAALACPASLLVDMPDPTSITITQA